MHFKLAPRAGPQNIGYTPDFLAADAQIKSAHLPTADRFTAIGSTGG
ncbi:MAG: hypothetical protein KF746_06030 [Chitinophagaceae bacterium]|nr:hypothetical protein [Chitinophagaceae bacterium]